MASETITRNDLTAILNEVLPPKPSEYRKLLWTNGSPTASFSPQELSLDLSGYDEVEIAFINYVSSNWNRRVTVKCPVGGSAIVDGIFGGTAIESGVIFAYARTIDAYSDHIAFGNAAGCADNGTFAIRNDMGVPIEIYGIKYDYVLPAQVEAADYVVEQGTSGIWTYRKWSSGIAECWGIGLVNGTWTAWGSIYFIQASFTYPFTFTTLPVMQANAQALTGISSNSTMSVGSYMGMTEESMKSGCSIALYRPTAGTNNANYPVNIYVIGRWK